MLWLHQRKDPLPSYLASRPATSRWPSPPRATPLGSNHRARPPGARNEVPQVQDPQCKVDQGESWSQERGAPVAPGRMG